mgnify:CR=1 FL=1
MSHVENNKYAVEHCKLAGVVAVFCNLDATEYSFFVFLMLQVVSFLITKYQTQEQ